MKTWTNAELVELNIGETAEGGRNLQSVDNYWTDRATGDLYASYASGGDKTGDWFDVTNKERK